MSTFTPQRDRDAWNTIRGYVYQVDLTIERWLNLQPGQTLELECGEDIDIVSRSLTATPEERQRLLEQVKHRVSSITLKGSEAVTAIACFIEHRQTNPTANLLFRFTTNTQVGKEKRSPIPNKAPAIAVWEEIRQGNLQGTAQNAVLQGIRTILKNVKQPHKLHDDTWQIFCDFITNTSDDQLLDLICSFEWSTKASDARSLSLSLQKLLIDRKHARDDVEAQEQYRRLFLYVFKLLCEPGIKRLTLEERSHQLSLPTLSETDHKLLNNVVVWVQALEERVQEHEERLGVLEQHLDRERTETYIGQEVADCVDNLLRDYTKLFVGRETTVKQLDEFLTQKRTNLLTLIAPAGFGKTALLANWVASRQDDGCFILYHFFSQRYDVTRSFSAAYRNLLRQLYDYYEPSDRQIPNNEDGLRDKLYRLIKEYSERDGRPLVIVLDALDEAEPPFRQFLPFLPENVFLIASARAEEGQEPEYLCGWTDNALPLRLNRLPKPPDPAIADWIRQTGEGELAAFAEDTHFVAQLDEITQGFPLYLGYLTEELIQAQQKGEDVQVVLRRSPKGFGAYVREQFKLLAKVKELRQRKVQLLFALVSVALGALSEDDIREITKLNEWDLAALPWQVTRWFSIQTGFYSFAHPLLAKEFQGVLPRQSSLVKEKLIKYCSRWQKHPSHYALRHYAEHLREEKQWEKLYAIARNPDFAVAQQQQLPDEPDLPLKTVQTALLGAAEEDKAERMAEFLLVHAHRLGQTNAQESPLEALRSGSLNRALALANLYDMEHRVLWYLLLVWVLKEQERLEEARTTLERLLEKELPRFSGWLSEYRCHLIMDAIDLSDNACTALFEQLSDDTPRRLLCQYLAAHGDFTHALKITCQIEDKSEQAWAFMVITEERALAEDFSTALEIVEQIEYRWQRAWALAAIAKAYADRGDLPTAQEIAEQIAYNSPLIRALAAIAKAHAQAGNPETAQSTFNSALLIALQMEDKLPIAEDLVNIAEQMVIAGARYKEAAQSILATAIETALQTSDGFQRPRVLSKIAQVQAQAGDVSTALETIRRIGDEWERAEALKELTEVQAQMGEFPNALKIASQIDQKCQQAQALGKVALAYAQRGDKKTAQSTFAKAFQIAGQLDNRQPGERSEALEELALAQAQGEDIEGAQSTIATILKTVSQFNWKRERAEALKAIEKVQAQVEDCATAQQKVRQIDNEVKQTDEPTANTPTQTQVEDISTALEMALLIDDERKPRKLAKFALAQFQRGDREAAQSTLALAIEAAKQLSDIHDEQAMELWGIVQVQAKMRDFANALETAQQIKVGHRKADALKTIAEVQAEAREFPAALQVARQINDEWKRSETIARIAEEQVKVGLAEQALKTTEIILTQRQWHLPRVAASFVKIGDKAHFKQLLIPCTYYLDAAYEMCGHLAKLYPTQATVLAKMVSNMNKADE